MKITEVANGLNSQKLLNNNEQSQGLRPVAGQQARLSEDERQKAEGLDRVKVHDAIKKLNETVRVFNRKLHFDLHKESKRWLVKVIDQDSGKVLREIPPKQILDLVAKLQEMVGLLVDERR